MPYRNEWHNLYRLLTPQERRTLYRQAQRRLFLYHHDHQLLFLAAALLSILYNPAVALLILPPAWLGLQHRTHLSLPTLRTLIAFVTGLALSTAITTQIASARPLAALILTPMLAALFTTIALTAIYLARPALVSRRI